MVAESPTTNDHPATHVVLPLEHRLCATLDEMCTAAPSTRPDCGGF